MNELQFKKPLLFVLLGLSLPAVTVSGQETLETVDTTPDGSASFERSDDHDSITCGFRTEDPGLKMR